MAAASPPPPPLGGRVGFVGLGAMGLPMAKNLAESLGAAGQARGEAETSEALLGEGWPRRRRCTRSPHPPHSLLPHVLRTSTSPLSCTKQKPPAPSKASPAYPATHPTTHPPKNRTHQPLLVYNRSGAKSAVLVASAPPGAAEAAPSLAALAAACGVVHIMLADDKAVDDVVPHLIAGGSDGGDVDGGGLRPGSVVVGHGTVHPDCSRRAAEALAAAGVEYVAAPVFGRRARAGSCCCARATARPRRCPGPAAGGAPKCVLRLSSGTVGPCAGLGPAASAPSRSNARAGRWGRRVPPFPAHAAAQALRPCPTNVPRATTTVPNRARGRRPDAAAARRLIVAPAGPAAAVARVGPHLAALGRVLPSVGEEPSKANVLKLTGNFMASRGARKPAARPAAARIRRGAGGASVGAAGPGRGPRHCQNAACLPISPPASSVSPSLL
jgi:3-hydroxyisobutyrate dehydrogenase-like beta-hydroxyacid dehydrogenase